MTGLRSDGLPKQAGGCGRGGSSSASAGAPVVAVTPGPDHGSTPDGSISDGRPGGCQRTRRGTGGAEAGLRGRMMSWAPSGYRCVAAGTF